MWAPKASKIGSTLPEEGGPFFAAKREVSRPANPPPCRGASGRATPDAEPHEEAVPPPPCPPRSHAHRARRSKILFGAWRVPPPTKGERGQGVVPVPPCPMRRRFLRQRQATNFLATGPHVAEEAIEAKASARQPSPRRAKSRLGAGARPQHRRPCFLAT